MEHIGVIDIGSNSVRLILVKMRHNGTFKIIDDIKETVKLGKGMENSPYIKADRIKKGLTTLNMFKELCDNYNTKKIIAFATAAVRKAKNKDEFLKRVKKETNIDVKILTGRDEAYYDYLGVVNSIDEDDGLIMDIGGGSIELAWMKNRELKECVSLPFGYLDLTDRFKIKDKITEKKEKKLIDFFQEKFKELNWLKKISSSNFIGVGGTIRNIAKIDRKAKKYPLRIIHNYRLNNQDVNKIYDRVKSKNYKKRRKIKGLSKKRAEYFVGASAAVATIINYCNLDNIIISGSGVREGMIYNYLQKEVKEDVLDYSIKNIITNYDLNKSHANHVYSLVKSLYKQLEPLHEYGNKYNKVIKTASLLHDAGINIRYYRHQDHTFYMIMYSGINGLTHKELILSAYIAASHRHKKYKLKNINFKDMLSKKDKKVIKKLGVLMRLGESLDRSMLGHIKDIKCEINSDQVVLHPVHEKNADLEISEVKAARKKFEKRFKKKLVVS